MIAASSRDSTIKRVSSGDRSRCAASMNSSQPERFVRFFRHHSNLGGVLLVRAATARRAVVERN